MGVRLSHNDYVLSILLIVYSDLQSLLINIFGNLMEKKTICSDIMSGMSSQNVFTFMQIHVQCRNEPSSMMGEVVLGCFAQTSSASVLVQFWSPVTCLYLIRHKCYLSCTILQLDDIKSATVCFHPQFLFN